MEASFSRSLEFGQIEDEDDSEEGACLSRRLQNASRCWVQPEASAILSSLSKRQGAKLVECA